MRFYSMMAAMSTAYLLVNLGTPLSPKPSDVKRYLHEFLLDPRVIDLPWWKRQLLVRGLIVPRRYRQSAEAYQRVWTERGSPLLLWGEGLQEAVQKEVGDEAIVALAMRYQEPGIEETLSKLYKRGLSRLVVLPLFPQYASATTGSVHQRVMEVVSAWPTIPEIEFVGSFPTEPKMIEAFAARGQEAGISRMDHVLFSFHGLPVSHLKKCDVGGVCKATRDCCSRKDAFPCYAAECHATARAITNQLGLDPKATTLSFQSRLGSDPWLTPFTLDTLLEFPKRGIKRVGVFCPSFVCDCLETIDEIGNEYRHQFLESGGDELCLVPGLNDHPLWKEAVLSLLRRNHEERYSRSS